MWFKLEKLSPNQNFMGSAYGKQYLISVTQRWKRVLEILLKVINSLSYKPAWENSIYDQREIGL